MVMGLIKKNLLFKREIILCATSDFVEDSHMKVRFVGIFTFEWCC